MSQELASKLCRQWSQAKDRRVHFDTHWEDVHRYAWPNSKDFTTTKTMQGEKKNLELFDETLLEDTKKGAHVLEAVLSRRGTRWGQTIAGEKELRKNARVKKYLQAVDDVLYAEREAPGASCYSALHFTYRSQLTAGNDAIWCDDRFDARRRPVGIRYKALDLRDVWVERDWQGFPAVVFRRYELPAEQLPERFDRARIPERLLKKAQEQPFDLVECLLVLRKNPDHDPDDPFSMAVLAVELLPGEKCILAEGGYHEWPLIFSNGELAPGEHYGRGEAMDLLPAAKTLNRMVRDMLVAGEKRSNPPLLTVDDGVLGVTRAIRIRAGAFTRGGISRDGKRLIDPLMTGADSALALELVEKFENRIHAAMYVNLFTLLAERPQMTAREIMERAEEKGVFLGPVVGDQQSQKLGPMHHREIGLHARAGRLPPMPPELEEAGGIVELEYETPAAQFQRAGELRNLEDAAASLIALAKETGDESILEVMDMRQAARRMLDLRGVRGELVRDERTVLRNLAARRPEAERQQAIEALPPVAKGVRDLAAAQKELAA